MSGSTKPATEAHVSASLAALISELFAASRGEKYGLTQQDFALILREVTKKYLPADAGEDAARALLTTVRVEDLALARACAAGNEAAWEAFLLRYREKLFDAARAIAREDSAARELADGVYADLFGTRLRDGERVSKLNSYMGRGSLEGWLRTVLAQEFVNRYRSHRREVSLEEQAEEGVQFAATQEEPGVVVDQRLEAATDEALAALAAEDRFILSSYYLDGRTLAEVARMLGVHESTVSRKVEKIAAGLRKAIKDGLARRGMSRAQTEEALEADVRDLRLDIRGRLAQESGGGAFHTKSASGQGEVRPGRDSRK